MNLHKYIGEKIKDARKLRGLSQDKFSEKVKVDRATVSLIENGKKNITVLQLYDIASALEFTIDSFIPPIDLYKYT